MNFIQDLILKFCYRLKSRKSEDRSRKSATYRNIMNLDDFQLRSANFQPFDNLRNLQNTEIIIHDLINLF